MKSLQKISFILLSAIALISSCRKDDETNPASTVTINISAPVEGATYSNGDTVHIAATITAPVEMHGYSWELINKADSSVLAEGESGEIHSESYTISEQWVNTMTANTQAALKITVHATHDDDVEKTVNITLNGQSQSGTVKLAFTNKVGAEALTYDTQWYKNAHNDSFQVNTFKYYVSNVKLNKAGGFFAESESYHLVNQQTASSMSFDMNNVPGGTYTSLTFMIGVDSLRNVSGAQTGALDPSNDMFWSWNTGYIMMKFEGVSPQSTEMGGMVMYHIGGFSGANSALRTVTLTFPQPLVVDANSKKVNINADLLALFASPNVIDFSTVSMIHMPGADSKKLADNYTNMFTVTSVE